MFGINYKYAYLYMYDCLKNQINTVKDYIILSKNKNEVSDEHETNVI